MNWIRLVTIMAVGLAAPAGLPGCQISADPAVRRSDLADSALYDPGLPDKLAPWTSSHHHFGPSS